MLDRFRALEIFVNVAEAGNLTGAAKALSTSPPSVTRLLSELEQELGVLLFHRTTRALTLTEPGQSFLEDAQSILQKYEEATDAVKGAHRAPKGNLRVTASTLFGQHYISPIIQEYLTEYPDVSVEAVYLDRVVNLVEEGFDLAVRIGRLEDSSLMATRVGEVRRVICGCPSYFEREGMPQTPKDLAKHSIIAARPVSATNNWRFRDGDNVTVTPRLKFSSMAAAIDATKTGWGMTRVLSYQIGPELGSGGLKTVLSDYEPEPLPIHLVHPEGRRASAKIRAFVDLASKRLRKDPYLNKQIHPR